MEKLFERLKVCVKSAATDLLAAAEVGEAEHLLDEEEAGESRENASDLLEAWNAFEEAWAMKWDRHETCCAQDVPAGADPKKRTCVWLKDGTKVVLRYLAGGTSVYLDVVPSAIIKVQTPGCR